MQRTGIIFVLAILIVSLTPRPAAAFDLRDYMPWLFGDEENKKPEDTLKAPFRNQMDSRQEDKAQQKGKNGELMDLYEKKEPMRGNTRENVDQRHRSERQIALWVTENVANALSFKPGDLGQQFQELRPAFTKSAFQSYRQSLQQRRFIKNMRNRDLRMNALVEDDPFLVEEGNEQGVYKWRFDVPVMISFTNRGVKEADNREAMSKKVSVRVQVTRKQGREKTEGVMIERWQMDKADE